MTRVDEYREVLRRTQYWEGFLQSESRLPGPRSNLELMQAAAEEGDRETFERLLAAGYEAPANTPAEFLAFCGVLGFGRLLAEGDEQYLERLRSLASDPRWRIRESVAMALQRLGASNMSRLLEEMKSWSQGNFLEQRAAAAAICEPALLQEKEHMAAVFAILDEVTTRLTQAEDRKSEEFKSLRKGLGYCWSVATAAMPELGKPAMEKWFSSTDRDVTWIMQENLKKSRLARMDAAWVEKWRKKDR